MAASEIMIAAGTAAVLAAILGGGLKGAGWELPVVNSIKRQLLLGTAGVALIAVGLLLGGGGRPVEREPEVAATIEEGVFFLSSTRDDRFRIGNRGYLVLVSHVQVRNRPHSRGDHLGAH